MNLERRPGAAAVRRIDETTTVKDVHEISSTTSGTIGNAKGTTLPHRYFRHFGATKAAHMRSFQEDSIYNVDPILDASGQLESITAAATLGADLTVLRVVATSRRRP